MLLSTQHKACRLRMSADAIAYSTFLAASLSVGAVSSVMDVSSASMSAAHSAAPTTPVSEATHLNRGWKGRTGVCVRKEHGSQGDHLEQSGDQPKPAG